MTEMIWKAVVETCLKVDYCSSIYLKRLRNNLSQDSRFCIENETRDIETLSRSVGH
jgi:hypothetical protein